MPDSANADQAATHQTTNDSLRERSALKSLATPAFVRGFCALGIAMVIGDLVTTVYGLNIGLQEQNPFVVEVLSRYGIAGLVGLKIAAIGWVAVFWRGLGRRYGIAAMAGLMVPQTIAVALNIATILAA